MKLSQTHAELLYFRKKMITVDIKPLPNRIFKLLGTILPKEKI